MSIYQKPLKDMDGVLLSLAIQSELNNSSTVDHQGAPLVDAMALAAFLHSGDTRMVPTHDSEGQIKQPSTPYIVHPLRCTLRLVRWGVSNVDVLRAAVLHDVVEDHAEDIVGLMGHDPDPMTPTEIRETALRYLTDIFGADVADIVNAVSNPIPSSKLSRVEKNALYVEHVKEDVLPLAGAFLVKVSDFIDNATSLHYGGNAEDSKRRANKYLPLAVMFLETWIKDWAPGSDNRTLLTDDGAAKMEQKLEEATRYLVRIIES